MKNILKTIRGFNWIECALPIVVLVSVLIIDQLIKAIF